MKIWVLPASLAITLISLSLAPASATTLRESCIHDQYFGTCLDIWGAGQVNNYTTTNYINNSYYNITGGSGDSYWLPQDADTIEPNGTYDVNVYDRLNVEASSVTSNITLSGPLYNYLVFGDEDIFGEECVMFWDTGTGGMSTTGDWAFSSGVSFGTAIYAPIVAGGEVLSYGDMYGEFAGSDFWLGGSQMGSAEMVIQQNGNVDFRTPNFTITSTGEVGIGTNAPAEMLDVHGNVTADDFITKSLAYSGDAVAALQGIRPEVYNGEFSKVDHSSMGELAVHREYYIPIKEYRNVTVCKDIYDPGKDAVRKKCWVDQKEEVVGYETRSYEGVSLDKTIAVLIKANQELVQRVQTLEERLGVKA